MDSLQTHYCFHAWVLGGVRQNVLSLITTYPDLWPLGNYSTMSLNRKLVRALWPAQSTPSLLLNHAGTSQASLVHNNWRTSILSLLQAWKNPTHQQHLVNSSIYPFHEGKSSPLRVYRLSSCSAAPFNPMLFTIPPITWSPTRSPSSPRTTYFCFFFAFFSSSI